MKQLRVQRKIYCSKDKELSRTEYIRLVKTALDRNDRRLVLILQTLCATGTRVSELRYITVEAILTEETSINLKGKIRTILIPRKLCKHIRIYIKKKNIRSGPVFVTGSGKPLDRSNIWRMIKKLCELSGVDSSKGFPHNFRHLFARSFYEADKDIAKLADILGHSSLATTRNYIVSTGSEHRKRMEALKLVI